MPKANKKAINKKENREKAKEQPENPITQYVLFGRKADGTYHLDVKGFTDGNSLGDYVELMPSRIINLLRQTSEKQLKDKMNGDTNATDDTELKKNND